MKALVWHGAGDLRIEEREPPVPGPTDAIIEVAYCGICGTDIHEYVHGPVLIRRDAHPLTGESAPITLGHEFSGRISSLGTEVEGFTVCQRVTVDPCWRCGECYWCRRGEYHICKSGGAVGLASHGGLASLVRVPSEGLVPIPDHIDYRVAALTEPLAVGFHAVHRGRVTAGDSVLVIGSGPVGVAVVIASVAAGASPVLVSEPSMPRRAIAQELGADETFDPTAVDVRREAYLRTGRIGPDVVFECTGSPGAASDAVESARRGGRIVLVGIGTEKLEYESRRLVFLERELIGSLGYQGDLQRVVEHLSAHTFDPSKLITSIVPLEEAIEGAFDRLCSIENEEMKVLVRVGGDLPVL